MAITTTTLIPFGTEYSASAAQINLPAGAYYGGVNIPGRYEVPQKTVIHFSTPRPASITAADSRHTVAMDVVFFGDALTFSSELRGWQLQFL